MYIGVYIQIKKCTKHEYFYDAIPGHNKKQIRFPPIMTQKETKPKPLIIIILKVTRDKTYIKPDVTVNK